MSVIEYNNLKYKVSEGIDWITEGRRLLYICKTFLPDGSESNIQNVLSLLDKLEEKNRLAIDSLAVLKDLLKELREWNLFEMVEKFENKRKEYKSLLEHCGRVLDECSQLKRLISVCEGKISHERRRHITDVSKLFTELEKQNNLGIERLEILKTMATEMDKPDLLQLVEEFDKKRKQEEDADRKRGKRQDQFAAVLAFARHAGRRLIGIVTTQCTFRNIAGGIVAVTTWMVLRKSSSLQEFVTTFTEAVLPLGNTLRAISEGSLCFTVQAETTSALEALWKTYQDGTLQRNIQEFLVTEEIKQLVGSEVSLTVKIDEQEYKDAVCDLEAEMEEKEEWKGFEDQSSSDPVHTRVREAHPEVREEISQSTELNLPESGLYEDTELELRELAKERMELERMAKAKERKELAKALRDSSPSVPSLSSVGGGLAEPELELREFELELREFVRMEPEFEPEPERTERMEVDIMAPFRVLSTDSSPSVPSLSSVGGGLADAKVEVEPKQQKQKEGSRVEFK